VAEHPRRWERTYPPDTDAVRQCRLEAEAVLRGWQVPAAAIGDAILVLGEIVGNAVRHARTEFTATLVVQGPILRLEVFDRDTRPPSLLGLDAESTSGRGLHIVAGVASNWGWQTADSDEGVSGKRVWAEIGMERTGGFEDP
jgi:anti-sigma regulatory factor (Ser/Thr protein kinase)